MARRFAPAQDEWSDADKEFSIDQNATLLVPGSTGVAALLSQWLAWYPRLPAIPFLLPSGIVAGPLLGWLDPDEMSGPLLFPPVSLAVALILFEGSLALHFNEWREIDTVMHRVVTIGALSTRSVIALAVHHLLDFSWEMALLFDTPTPVTGPTVTVPMLRVVRPRTAVVGILHWENIVIDPVSALLAVVVYSFITSNDEGGGWLYDLQTLGEVIPCGSLFGISGGWALSIVLRRHWLPDYLHNLVTLAVVPDVFTTSNRVMYESGLLTATLVGMGPTNVKGVDAWQILRFEENLNVLLVPGLFIPLAVCLDINALPGLGPTTSLALLPIRFVTRLLDVTLSTWGSPLNWHERALFSWIVPRGIVAVAVSAVFAIRLDAEGHAQAALLVPLTFLVIIGTVVLQGVIVRPPACPLKVAEPSPNGYLIAGTNPVGHAIGKTLRSLGNRVLLTDSSWEDICVARMDNLPTYFGNPTSQHAEAHLDLIGIGHLLRVSPADELSTLAVMRFHHEFGRRQLFGLPTSQEAKHTGKHCSSDEHRGRSLGQRLLAYAQFVSLLSRGAETHTTLLTDTFGRNDYQALRGESAIPLFARNPNGRMHAATPQSTLALGTGQVLLSLIGAGPSVGESQATEVTDQTSTNRRKTVVTLSKVG